MARKRRGSTPRKPRAYEPTPEQIAAEAAEIRKTWVKPPSEPGTGTCVQFVPRVVRYLGPGC